VLWSLRSVRQPVRQHGCAAGSGRDVDDVVHPPLVGGHPVTDEEAGAQDENKQRPKPPVHRSRTCHTRPGAPPLRTRLRGAMRNAARTPARRGRFTVGGRTSLGLCLPRPDASTSMADADDVRRLALALPHVEEIDSEGFDFRVGNKGFVWSYPERNPGQRRVIRTDVAVLYVGDEAEKQALLLGEPDVFFTARGYEQVPLVMLRRRGGRRTADRAGDRRLADAGARRPGRRPRRGRGAGQPAEATAVAPMSRSSRATRSTAGAARTDSKVARADPSSGSASSGLRWATWCSASSSRASACQ